MNREQKKGLVRIGAALALFLGCALLPLPQAAVFWGMLGAYALAGWDILWRAARNAARGRVFDENFLMALATVGAMFLGEYREGTAVMLFYQVGEWFQNYAVARSRTSIAALMDIRPDFAALYLPGGATRRVAPEEVEAGALILVKPGERVPLDGVVQQGNSTLDTAALTGESVPRAAREGSEVISGCINLGGALVVRTTRAYGASTVARILELVENSGEKKARQEQFITRFARWYTPLVCAAALALAVLPPLVLSAASGPWVYRALTFLVISCPCALVISVPLSFFGGIGGASKMGVLVKGGNCLEQLARAETVVFDKTGTLTEGRFAVSEVYPQGKTKEELLRLAALAERYSNHPIAQCVRAAYAGELAEAEPGLAGEEPGRGVYAVVKGQKVLAGSARLMRENGVALPPPASAGGTVVHVAAAGVYAGWLLVEDAVKASAPRAVAALREEGVRKMVMLSGDGDEVGRRVAGRLGLDAAYTRLLPQEKVERLEGLLAAPRRGGSVVYVGDGVNDAPVLARADVGVAMGALGADAAIEAADVVIMNDDPMCLWRAIRLARRTMRIVRQNIALTLGVKAVVLALGALGWANMWAAVFADVGVAVLAILNAMRALRTAGAE